MAISLDTAKDDLPDDLPDDFGGGPLNEKLKAMMEREQSVIDALQKIKRLALDACISDSKDIFDWKEDMSAIEGMAGRAIKKWREA